MEPHMCVYLRTKFQVYGTILTIFTKEWVGGGGGLIVPNPTTNGPKKAHPD